MMVESQVFHEENKGQSNYLHIYNSFIKKTYFLDLMIQHKMKLVSILEELSTNYMYKSFNEVIYTDQGY